MGTDPNYWLLYNGVTHYYQYEAEGDARMLVSSGMTAADNVRQKAAQLALNPGRIEPMANLTLN